MEAKRPNGIDVLVGAQIRLRRRMLGLSQGKLADHLGITFQQVQKYEKGTNRVGASRLMDIAKTLDVAPNFFFQGSEALLPQDPAIAESDELASFIRSNEGIALNRAFARIKDPAIRKRVVALTKTIARQAEDSDAETSVEAGHVAETRSEQRL